jgi:hypothetical protein
VAATANKFLDLRQPAWDKECSSPSANGFSLPIPTSSLVPELWVGRSATILWGQRSGLTGTCRPLGPPVTSTQVTASCPLYLTPSPPRVTPHWLPSPSRFRPALGFFSGLGLRLRLAAQAHAPSQQSADTSHILIIDLAVIAPQTASSRASCSFCSPFHSSLLAL